MLLKLRFPGALAGQSRPGHHPGWTGLVAFWIERARQRRALAELDDRCLADIGLSRDDVFQEIRKPFWR